jgi:heptosyltransferase II
MQIRKILILQFRPFGDVLLCTSYLSALKEQYPNAEIHYLCNTPFHTVIEKHPFIDKIINIPYVKGISKFFQFRAWLQIRKQQYDLIIDQQNGTESALFVLVAGAKYRVTWGNSKWISLYNLKAAPPPNIYSAVRNLTMLHPLGIYTNKYELIVTVSEEGKEMAQKFWKLNNLEGKKVIGIEASCKDPKKRWHEKGFVELINNLVKQTDVVVVLFSAPTERSHLEQIMDKVAHHKLLLSPQSPSLREVAAFLEKIDLLVCNEGAINHLSCATKTPALCLIGPSEPDVWSPTGYFPDHLHLKNPAWKYESTERDFGISSQEVFDKCIEMLKTAN